MSESPFTLFFNLSVAVMCLLLAFVEVTWLRKTLHLTEIWRSVAIIGVVNYFFFGIFYFFGRSYVAFFIFPLPVLPAIYLVSKVALYYFMQKYSLSAIQQPWLVASLSIPFHGFVLYLVLTLMDVINPTRENMDAAIREKQDIRFAIQLAVSVVHEPYLTNQINRAIETDNVYAIRRLLAAGADPRADYALDRGTPEITLLFTQWRIDRGVPIIEIPSIDLISVAGPTAQLMKFIDQGLDVTKLTRTIHIAILKSEQAEGGTMTTEESKILIDKLRILLDQGVSIYEPDEYGLGPVISTLRCGDLHEVMEFLISKGAAIDAVTPIAIFPKNRDPLPEGITPLMMAAALKYVKTIEVLVKHHARNDLKDSSGKTALDYAHEAGLSPEIVKLLE